MLNIVFGDDDSKVRLQGDWVSLKGINSEENCFACQSRTVGVSHCIVLDTYSHRLLGSMYVQSTFYSWDILKM